MAAALWSIPWVLPPVVAVLRSMNSRSLDDESPDVPTDAPLVSVIIPARNESRNIERCLESVLASTYTNIEVIVVDDHSMDGTGDLARELAGDDKRVKVVENEPLPPGWLGKQWACNTGYRLATGKLLLFTDADTRHKPDLLVRCVNAMRKRKAQLFTIAGHQEMHSFWERVVQPQVFAMLSLRYGGTEHVSHATRPVDVIANGQFILFDRAGYEAVGGHEAVKDQAAEDLMLAQAFVRAKRPIAMMLAMRQFSTHMYASLGEVIQGWRKNMYAAGRHTAPGGAVGRALFPFVLIATPLVVLAPPTAFALALAGVLSHGWLIWGGISAGVALLYSGVAYWFMGERLWWAVVYPLGALMVLRIAIGAVFRGRRIGWKGRVYLAR